MSQSTVYRDGSGRGGHDSWPSSLQGELQRWRNMHQTGAAAIVHRVPPSMRVNPSTVEPAVVSIGPYHHGKASLQPTEQHKWGSLDAIRQLNRKRTAEDYLREMAALEMPARRCYSEDVAHMGRQEFTAMLLLDGCFLAVLFLQGDTAGSRPQWFTPAVARDVILLENQVPFFVVQKIADMASSSTGSSPNSIAKGAAEMVRDILGLHANIPMESAGQQVYHHLLHLLHSLFFCPVLEPDAVEASTKHHKKAPLDGASRPRTMLSLLPSASELQDAGVKLKKREKRGLLDATFHDSTMQVPFLRVDRFTASLLQSLVAWEGSHGGAGNHTTVYVLFMDRLVRTARDVAVLSEKGILEHRLSSDGEVAGLFEGLAAGIPLDLDGGCYLKPTMLRLRKYQKSNLHKWKAWIKREFSANDEPYLSLLLDA